MAKYLKKKFNLCYFCKQINTPTRFSDYVLVIVDLFRQEQLIIGTINKLYLNKNKLILFNKC